MERPVPSEVRAVVDGVAAAVLAFAVGWVLLLVVLLFAVGVTGTTPFVPGHWAVTPGLGVGAAVVGLAVARVRWASSRKFFSLGDLAKRLVAVSALAAVMTGGWMLAERGNERAFLRVFTPTVAAEHGDDLVSAGNEACDWLQDRPWGQPAGPELNPYGAAPEGYLTKGPKGRMNPPPGATTSTQSTTTLSVQYAEWVDAQYSASQADEQRLQIQASIAAWYNLCPISRELRRPFASGGD
jgi:hypothetical protein